MIAAFKKAKMSDIVFDTFNILIMLVVIFVTLYPFWFCIIGSFNQGLDYMRGGVYWWPRKFTILNYMLVFTQNDILSAYQITVLRTLLGTVVHVLFSAIFAYGFSRKYLAFKNFYAKFGIFSMFFSAGLIPTYLLYTKLHLINNFWVYIIPAMFSFYHVIIFQSFFRTIPDAINESAMMDGAGEYRIFFHLILPLSKPVLASIVLFEGVKHWNAFFDAMVFTTSQSLQTIQVYLVRMIRASEQAAVLATVTGVQHGITDEVNSATLKLATMMVTTAPILILYPFLQKYFVKGLMVGSVKG